MPMNQPTAIHLTRTTNARIAGFAFLSYIAAGLPYGLDVRVGVVLGLLTCFAALVLAVTLYALTRDIDGDLALLGLTCRVAEGVLGAIFIPARLALLSLGTGTADPLDAGTLQALNAFLQSAR